MIEEPFLRIPSLIDTRRTTPLYWSYQESKRNPLNILEPVGGGIIVIIASNKVSIPIPDFADTSTGSHNSNASSISVSTFSMFAVGKSIFHNQTY